VLLGAVIIDLKFGRAKGKAARGKMECSGGRMAVPDSEVLF